MDVKDVIKKYGSHVKHRADWVNIADKKLKELGGKSILDVVVANKNIENPGLFIASLFEEGLAKRIIDSPNQIGRIGGEYGGTTGDNKDYPYSGVFDFGLDTFGESMQDFINKGLLDPSIKDNVLIHDSINESGNNFKTADFNSIESAIKAKNAFVKNSKNNLTKIEKDLGVTLSPEAKEFFSVVGYNTGLGNQKQMIESFNKRGYLKDDQFLEDGFEPEYWKNPYKYSMRRYQSSKLLEDNFDSLKRFKREDQAPIENTVKRDNPFDTKNRLGRTKEEAVNPLNRDFSSLLQSPEMELPNQISLPNQSTPQVEVQPEAPTEAPVQSTSQPNVSFSEAFKQARTNLGDGQTFEWQGNQFSTNYKEEVDKKYGGFINPTQVNPMQEQYFLGGMLGSGTTSGSASGVTGMASGMLGGLIPGQNKDGNTSIGGSAAKGALSGIAAGASFGPIGMGIGALVGGAAGFFGGKKAQKNELAEQAEQQQLMNDQSTRNALAQMNFSNSSNLPMSYGGNLTNPMETPIGSFNDFPVGGTHESNPNGGIPQGTNSNGQLRTVEEGESKFRFPQGEYIFSNRLKFE